MSDFSLGLIIGGLTIGLFTIPFIIYFGNTHFNLIKYEKNLLKQNNKNIVIVPDPETEALIKTAEKLIANTNKQ